jgi:hypothetical protein
MLKITELTNHKATDKELIALIDDITLGYVRASKAPFLTIPSETYKKHIEIFCNLYARHQETMHKLLEEEGLCNLASLDYTVRNLIDFIKSNKSELEC